MDILNSIKGLLGENILKNLSEKKINIPESVIREQLSSKLEEKNVELESLKCSGNDIAIKIKAKKFGIKSKYKAKIKIDQLCIDPDNHNAIFEIVSDDIKGNGIFSEIIIYLFKLIIDDIFEKTINYTDLKDLVVYDKNNRKATIDLINIDHIAKLYEPQAVLLGKPIIDFFQIKSLSHIKSGLDIHFDIKIDNPIKSVIDFFKKWKINYYTLGCYSGYIIIDMYSNKKYAEWGMIWLE